MRSKVHDDNILPKKIATEHTAAAGIDRNMAEIGTSRRETKLSFRAQLNLETAFSIAQCRHTSISCQTRGGGMEQDDDDRMNNLRRTSDVPSVATLVGEEMHEHSQWFSGAGHISWVSEAFDIHLWSICIHGAPGVLVINMLNR